MQILAKTGYWKDEPVVRKVESTNSPTSFLKKFWIVENLLIDELTKTLQNVEIEYVASLPVCSRHFQQKNRPKMSTVWPLSGSHGL